VETFRLVEPQLLCAGVLALDVDAAGRIGANTDNSQPWGAGKRPDAWAERQQRLAREHAAVEEMGHQESELEEDFEEESEDDFEEESEDDFEEESEDDFEEELSPPFRP
jgi:hypothetical protein